VKYPLLSIKRAKMTSIFGSEKKEDGSEKKREKIKSTREQIRTATPVGATPSRWCVYQFRHPGII